MKPLGETVFLGLAILTSAYGGDDRALKKELAALQGKWNVVRFDAGDGKEVDTTGATLEFFKDGETVEFTRAGKTKKGRYKIDLTTKPKTITILPPPDSKSTREEIGIYKIEKNVLTICGFAPTRDRMAKEFTAKAKKYDLWTLERAK